MESDMDQDSMMGNFFKGKVNFLRQQPMFAIYRIVENGALIAVKNDLHIRLIDDQLGIFPEDFTIIAPDVAIDVIDGSIPQKLMHFQSSSEYLMLRRKHHGV
jgi:hypothetical protein